MVIALNSVPAISKTTTRSWKSQILQLQEKSRNHTIDLQESIIQIIGQQGIRKKFARSMKHLMSYEIPDQKPNMTNSIRLSNREGGGRTSDLTFGTRTRRRIILITPETMTATGMAKGPTKNKDIDSTRDRKTSKGGNNNHTIEIRIFIIWILGAIFGLRFWLLLYIFYFFLPLL